LVLVITLFILYREKLNISQNQLDNIRWHEIVEKLIHLHVQGIHRVAVNDLLTEHDVVSRILRKENYMVALINKVLYIISKFIIFFNKIFKYLYTVCVCIFQ
jgi:hypothetical protein